MPGLAPPSQERMKKKGVGLVSIGVMKTRQSFQPWHKHSKDLFVLNIPWERVVSDEIIHGNQGQRGFFGIGPRNRPMPSRVSVVIGGRACGARLGDDRWARIVGDGRQVTQPIRNPRDVTGS